jgi:diguanylate cyclase (GGDEF)-like protein
MPGSAADGPLGNFRAQEFTGFALFDLDHFKRVNDTHGHAVGDMVLKTVAGVLDGHEDAVALRMGGEEFLLLLRGGRVAERVEHLREAIPVRIAREVAELELLVTASAGLVEAPPGAPIGGDFVALYRAADDLLYEAKHNGRNLLAAMRQQPAAAPVAASLSAAAA